MIPPNSLNHQIIGHCAAGTYETLFTVFAGFLHTHLAGRSIFVKQIRHNEELPYILYDGNYNFDYQEHRVLRQERLILPGDQLYVQCGYENTDRNGNATIGGFSTRSEMCAGILWYYPRLEQSHICESELKRVEYRKFLQIYNETWSNERVAHVIIIVINPKENAGPLVSDVATLRMNWTLTNRERLQNFHLHSPQISVCPQTVQEKENSWSIPSNSQGNTTPGSFKKTRMATKTIQETNRFHTGTLNAQGFENSNSEFLSVYPRHIRVYRRPSGCRSI